MRYSLLVFAFLSLTFGTTLVASLTSADPTPTSEQVALKRRYKRMLREARPKTETTTLKRGRQLLLEAESETNRGRARRLRSIADAMLGYVVARERLRASKERLRQAKRDQTSAEERNSRAQQALDRLIPTATSSAAPTKSDEAADATH